MTDNPFLWYHSQDEERMTLLHDKPMTFDEAREEVLSLGEYKPGDLVYLVEANKQTPPRFDADRILEIWIDDAEECWDPDNDPKVSGEVRRSLQATLDVWFRENASRLPQPWCFGTVRESHTITIPPKVPAEDEADSTESGQ